MLITHIECYLNQKDFWRPVRAGYLALSWNCYEFTHQIRFMHSSQVVVGFSYEGLTLCTSLFHSLDQCVNELWRWLYMYFVTFAQNQGGLFHYVCLAKLAVCRQQLCIKHGGINVSTLSSNSRWEGIVKTVSSQTFFFNGHLIANMLFTNLALVWVANCWRYGPYSICLTVARCSSVEIN